ncbi:metallophosphoesterase family protein [Vibrio astriarenae]
MKRVISLLSMAVLAGCNSSSSDDNNNNTRALNGYAIDDFVLNASVYAKSFEGGDIISTTSGEMGQFTFSGENALNTDEVYLINVRNGVLDRDGKIETTDFQIDFTGHQMKALVRAGESRDLIVNPLTTGIAQYVLDNDLSYEEYTRLLDELPGGINELNALSANGISDLEQLGYAIGHFTQAASETGVQIDGLYAIIDSLVDNGRFDDDSELTITQAVNNFRSAKYYGMQSSNFVTPAGQYAQRMNDDSEPLRIGLVPDTQGSGDNNSWLLQDGLMKHYVDEGVDLVLAVGDLTNSNTQYEYDHWLRVMDKYSERQDMTILPVRGNHEKTWYADDGGTQIFIDNLEHMMTDAEHMPGYENLTYAYTQDNVLVIMVDVYIHDNPAEYDSGKSAWVTTYPWLKEMVEKYRDDVDHIIVGTHEPMFGRQRNGRWIEVDAFGSSDGDTRTQYGSSLRKEIIKFFADNNVIYVSGHDHQYSRSAILIDEDRDVSTSKVKHAPVQYFDHIISGNASFKEYGTRYYAGAYNFNDSAHERMVSRHTMQQTPVTGLNSSILTFKGNEIDYVARVAAHDYTQADQDIFEADGNFDDAYDYDIPWREIDRFTKVKGAYTRILDAENSNSKSMDSIIIRSEQDDEYVGTSAILIKYYNYLFNTYSTAGYSAGSEYYRNAEAATKNLDVMVNFSYLSDGDNADTVTDVLMVSGTQQQDGAHLDSGGNLVPREDGDFSADRIDYGHEIDGFIEDVPGDIFALGFIVPDDIDIRTVEPARYDEATGNWVSQAYDEAELERGLNYSDNYMRASRALPDSLSHLTDQERHKIHGVEEASRMVWFHANRDGKYALVRKGTATPAE